MFTEWRKVICGTSVLNPKSSVFQTVVRSFLFFTTYNLRLWEAFIWNLAFKANRIILKYMLIFESKSIHSFHFTSWFKFVRSYDLTVLKLWDRGTTPVFKYIQLLFDKIWPSTFSYNGQDSRMILTGMILDTNVPYFNIIIVLLKLSCLHQV